MVRDTVGHLRAEGQRVFLDAEHFFDGYRDNRDYALEVLREAYDAGAEVVALCDTNGGMLPPWVVRRGARRHRRRPGCGSASTATTTPAARSPTRWRRSTRARPTSRAPSTATASAPATPTSSPWSPTSSSSSTSGCCPTGCSGRPPASRTPSPRSPTSRRPPASPTSGVSAFAHKAGLHASAIKVDPDLYQHLDPVGGRQRHAAAGLRHGRASLDRAEGSRARLRPRRRDGDRELVTRVTARVKELESRGYTFEAADASFELLLVEEVEGTRPSYFDVESWRVITDSSPGGEARLGGDRQAARRRRAHHHHR